MLCMLGPSFEKSYQIFGSLGAVRLCLSFENQYKFFGILGAMPIISKIVQIFWATWRKI